MQSDIKDDGFDDLRFNIKLVEIANDVLKHGTDTARVIIGYNGIEITCYMHFVISKVTK